MSLFDLDLSFDLAAVTLKLKILGSVGMLSHGVIFNLGPAKVCSPAIIETYFSYDKYIWIAVTDYHMYFNLIVLFLLKAILQLINFYNLQTFSFSLLYVILSSNIIWTFTYLALFAVKVP